MTTSKYYIRVHPEDDEKFREYLVRNGIIEKHLSTDMGAGGGSSMYGIQLTQEQLLSMKLSFRLSGCLDFKKVGYICCS